MNTVKTILELIEKKLCLQNTPQTQTNHKARRPADAWQTFRHTSCRSCDTTTVCVQHKNSLEPLLFTFKAHKCLRPLSRTPTHYSTIHPSNPMTNPTLRPSPLVLCQILLYPSLCQLTPPHKTRLSPPDARTISLCAFGPRCGRAALCLPASKQCHRSRGGASQVGFSMRGILPLAQHHPFPWPVPPNKHPIYLPGTRLRWVRPFPHLGSLSNRECLSYLKLKGENDLMMAILSTLPFWESNVVILSDTALRPSKVCSVH